MPATQSATPTVTQAQLRDPALSVLNQILSFLWTKLSDLYAPKPVTLASYLTVRSLAIPSQTQVPTDTTQVATVSTVQALIAQQSKGVTGLGATLVFATTFQVNGTGPTYTTLVIQNGQIVQYQ